MTADFFSVLIPTSVRPFPLTLTRLSLPLQDPRITVDLQAPQPETCTIRLASEQLEELTLEELTLSQLLDSETTFMRPSVRPLSLSHGLPSIPLP